jgi:hypothetical protein
MISEFLHGEIGCIRSHDVFSKFVTLFISERQRVSITNHPLCFADEKPPDFAFNLLNAQQIAETLTADHTPDDISRYIKLGLM